MQSYIVILGCKRLALLYCLAFVSRIRFYLRAPCCCIAATSCVVVLSCLVLASCRGVVFFLVSCIATIPCRVAVPDVRALLYCRACWLCLVLLSYLAILPSIACACLFLFFSNLFLSYRESVDCCLDVCACCDRVLPWVRVVAFVRSGVGCSCRVFMSFVRACGPCLAVSCRACLVCDRAYRCRVFLLCVCVRLSCCIVVCQYLVIALRCFVLV